jgi:hypothetical protein
MASVPVKLDRFHPCAYAVHGQWDTDDARAGHEDLLGWY